MTDKKDDPSMLTKVLYTIAGVSAFTYIAGAIAAFFEIGFETYGVYLFFIIAIALFNSFLPPEEGTFFKKRD